MNESVIYQEEQTLYPWLMALITLVCLSGIIVSILMGVPLREHGTWVAWLVVIVVVILLGLFRKLTVQITPTQLVFGYPIWKKRAPLNEVLVGEVVKIPYVAGMGIHYWAGKTYVNARMGGGLEVIIGGRTFVIGSNQPHRLSSAIKSVIAGNHNPPKASGL
jgi:hypothetical protein